LKNQYSTRVKIPDGVVARCRKFATEVADHQESTEFRNSNTKPRSREDVIDDTFMGKLGEEAVAMYLRKFFEVVVLLDYNIYEDKCIGDDQDIEINGWRIEIKTTKSTSRYLLVDQGNIDSKTTLGTLPHACILCKVGRDRDDTGKPYVFVDIEGWAGIDRVKESLFLKAGQFIPNTDTKLQAPNYLIHEDHLNHNLMSLFKHTMTHKP
jgi:hypothetical protein